MLDDLPRYLYRSITTFTTRFTFYVLFFVCLVFNRKFNIYVTLTLTRRIFCDIGSLFNL